MDFISLARHGKNDWWRYVLSVLLILSGWIGASLCLGIVLIAIVLFDNNPATDIDSITNQFIGVEPAVQFIVAMLGAAALFVLVLVAVRVIHQRPVLSLITPHARVDWKRFGVGFSFFMFLGAIASLIEALLFPGRYQLTFQPTAFFSFVPLVLVLIPIQTAGEELLFRGYMMQSLGLLTRRPHVVAFITSFVFMLLHLFNPEVSANVILMPLYYFGVGLLFALVTLRDNRLELAMGAHAGANIFTALFANYTITALPSPSIFTVSTLDAPFGLASFVVIAVIFYAGLFARRAK
jgi:membrane protease YdiL (CAAX protease family)